MVSLRVGALRQVVPDTLDYCFSIVLAGDRLRGSAARAGADRGAAALRGCENEWEIELPVFMCPTCGARGAVEVASGNEFEVESIEVEEAECIAPR